MADGKRRVSDILEQPGGMRFSMRVLLLAGLAMIFDGYDYMIVSFTMSQIMEEMGLGFVETGSLASFSVLGMLIGGLLSGVLADRFGRKHVLNVSIAIYALLTVPVVFVHSYDAFAVCRVLSGVGVGAVIPLCMTLASEYAPTKHRGLFSTATKMFMMLGWVIAGLLAMFVIPRFGWRMCYLIGGFPLVYAFVMHRFMPESVHWLMRKGRDRDALAIVNDINRHLDDPRPHDYAMGDIDFEPPAPTGQIRELFSKRYLRVTIGVWLVAFTTCALSYGLSNWMPTILMESGYTLQSSYALTTIMNALGCVGALFAGFMADRVGRIRSTYIAVALAIAAVVFMGTLGFGGSLVIPAVVLLGFAVNYAYMTPQPITIEVYPTEIRATGQACTTTIARIGGLIVPVIIGGLMESGMVFQIVMVAFVVPLLLAALFTKVLIRDETKGRSIEELDSKGVSVSPSQQ